MSERGRVRFAFYAYDLDGYWDAIGYSAEEYGRTAWRRAFMIWRTYDVGDEDAVVHASTRELEALYGPPFHTS